jgi:hypothetical protein
MIYSMLTKRRWGRRGTDIVIITHSLTHGAEPFLRSCQLCSYSRTSQHFMEPEGSLLCSQEPSTGPYPEPDQSNLYHPILSKIHPPTSWSSQWSSSFRLSHQYPICIPPLPIRATCPAHLIHLDLTILIILGVFSNLLSLHLSSVQIFSSGPC